MSTQLLFRQQMTREFLMAGDGASILMGEFVEGKRHGYGVTHYKNGNVYEGYYENDKRHGSCVFKFARGDVFEGTFENNEAHGSCTYTYADGTRQEGWFEKDCFIGVEKGQLSPTIVTDSEQDKKET